MLLYSSLFQKFVNTFEILQLQGYKQQHRVSTTFSLSSAFSCASRTFKLSSPVSFSNLSSNSDSVNLNKKPDHTEFFCSWSFFFSHTFTIHRPEREGKHHPIFFSTTSIKSQTLTHYPRDNEVFNCFRKKTWSKKFKNFLNTSLLQSLVGSKCVPVVS